MFGWSLMTLFIVWAELQMELDIAYFAKLVGDVQTVKKFLAASHSRRETLKSVFWNDEMGQWLDYRLRDDECEVGRF